MKHLLSLVVALAVVHATDAGAKVTILATPNGGIQPQALVDASGTLHLLYFKGEASAGDLFYTRRPTNSERFSTPIRVNSQPKSAIATGTVRGGQLALGKAERVHVVWNGTGKPKEALFYARMNDAHTAFDPQRDLIGDTAVMDGGGTVAADAEGNVYVAWHALKKNDERGEEHRRVWVAHSMNEGKSFSKEIPAWSEPTGVCPCCSMRAFADNTGAVSMLYRSATDGVNRDIYLLTSKDKGRSFDGTVVHKWKVPG